MYTMGGGDGDFPPKPADLRRLVAESSLLLPSEDDAWREVMEEIRRVGSGAPVYIAGMIVQPKPTFSCPEVASAVEGVGWQTLREHGNDTYTLDAFKKAYSRYKGQTMRIATVSPAYVTDHRVQLTDRLRGRIEVGAPRRLAELGVPESVAAIAEGRATAPDAAYPTDDPSYGSDERWTAKRDMAALTEGVKRMP